MILCESIRGGANQVELNRHNTNGMVDISMKQSGLWQNRCVKIEYEPTHFIICDGVWEEYQKDP